MIGSLPLNAPEPESRTVPALRTIEGRLTEVVTSADETINPPTSHLVETGGKRLHPVLALLIAQLGNPTLMVTGERICDAGMAVKLTRIATLYHNDVMDETPLCRGAPSAWIVWGDSIAILTGNALVTRAFQLVAALGLEAIMAHAKIFECLRMGQLRETLPRPTGTDPVDHCIQVPVDKTGSLTVVSVRYGAMFAGAGTHAGQIMEELGKRIGVVFQLIGDIIGLVSDSVTTGKTPGIDLHEGVDTMPIPLLHKALAAGELDAVGQATLSRLSSGNLSDGTFLSDAAVHLRKHLVLARTRGMIMDWAVQAVEGLEGLEEAALDGTRQRLAQAGTEGETAAVTMTDVDEQMRQVHAAMEDFTRILMDRVV